MYRSVLFSIVLVAAACKGGANAASKSNSLASDTPQVAQTSDTGAAVAGPISTTEIPSPGSAANPAGGAPAPAGPATGSAAISGTPNPNRVPNEMGRIMVLEYHLIGDRNSAYSRERGQFRKDLELLYDRGYRPVNMTDVLDKKLNLPRGLSPVVMVFDDASPEQFRYIENNGKLEIDPTSGLGIWLDFRKTHPEWSNKGVFCLLSGASAGLNFFGDRGIQ
jgi:hypothetical protein